MAEIGHGDLVEQILVRSEVKDLIRFKSVCKSWHSLITSPRFINRHLNRSYNKDRRNKEFVHRRITLITESVSRHHLVGSSNGLVCITPENYSKVIVVNPLTREARQLSSLPPCLPECWGFGYDASSDDCKVIAGDYKGENQTCVQVLSLKSNVWIAIGEVKYRFHTKIGILCNGALHWIVKDQNQKMLILSYNLSTSEFEEIPKPKDARYECNYSSNLGSVIERLCIFSRYGYSSDGVWLLEKYNVKESWELLRYGHDRHLEMKYDMVHILRLGSTNYDDESWFCRASAHHYTEYMDAPIFLQSLVSPHVNVRPKQASNNKRIAKLINQWKSFLSWTKCLISMVLKRS